jgi:hypothetical protein
VPGWGRLLRKLMNNCETDISIRGSRPEHAFTALNTNSGYAGKPPPLFELRRVRKAGKVAP